jgi:hypothetical protein
MLVGVADDGDGLDALRASVRSDLDREDVGVYEVWWEANGLFPDWPASRRLAAAETVVTELIDEGLVRLWRGRWVGPEEERRAVPSGEVTDVLRAWSTWVPQQDEVVWMDAHPGR